MFPEGYQLLPGWCWGTTGYGYQCMSESKFCVGAQGAECAWSCSQHLAQMVNTMQGSVNAERVIVVGVKWPRYQH